MGCCFSTPKCPKQDRPVHRDASGIVQQSHPRSPEHKSNATHEIDDQAPPGPPPPLVEETVKEVLSETPISKPQVSTSVEERSTQMAVIKPGAGKFEKVDEVSEVSQLSEICSFNESFSTSTTTTMTTPISVKMENEATSKRLNQPPSSNVPRKRSCSIDSSDGRERRPKSPARRSEPSPEKKKSQVNPRSVCGRESGKVATRKPNVGPSRVRGEASGRRSKSPSTRAVSAASGRIPVKPPAKAAENSESEKVVEKNDNNVPPDPPESLDNPLVSLECFIFL